MRDGLIDNLSFSGHCADFASQRFCCGDRDIDTWFRNRSLQHHNARKHIVTCVHEAESPTLMGFYALSVVVDDLARLPTSIYRPFFGSGQTFPCLYLVNVAVDQRFQGKHVGTKIMGRILDEFATLGLTTGLPFLTLTPLNDRVAQWYADLGFERFKRGGGMFLPLETVIAGREPQ